MCLTSADAVPPSSARPLLAGMFSGSRRARLWDLPEIFHCPLIGVCLSPKAIQKLIARLAAAAVPGNDYECHSLAVNACRQRGAFSELLQKELDAKHRLAIGQCRPLDSPPALLAAWKAAIAKGDIAGCFWALVTHPKVNSAVRELIYRDVHMIQHQAGASIRVDLQAFDALGRENATLLREMGRIQKRMTDFVHEKTAQADRLQAELLRRDQELVRLKAQLDEREAENRRLSRAAGLQQQNLALQATVERLTRKLQAQATDIDRLRAAPAARPGVDEGAGTADLQHAPAAGSAAAHPPARPARRLEQKTVFVVGGRQGSFNEYRCTIEQAGARFLYHDGGLEHSLQTLESGLQAADYVICQTGCISHASYWKVKDYCKRTGTRCEYVESPGVSSLRQSIERLGEAACGGQ